MAAPVTAMGKIAVTAVTDTRTVTTATAAETANARTATAAMAATIRPGMNAPVANLTVQREKSGVKRGKSVDSNERNVDKRGLNAARSAPRVRVKSPISPTKPVSDSRSASISGTARGTASASVDAVTAQVIAASVTRAGVAWDTKSPLLYTKTPGHRPGVSRFAVWRVYSAQLTPVRSFACVGAFSHKPSILEFATPVFASWNRYPFT